VKIEMLQGLYSTLATRVAVGRLLCGDFNTPQEERSSGEIVTWGQRIRGDGSAVVRTRVLGRPGAEWDKAERDVLLGLAEHDLRDVFRGLYGYGAEEFSWFIRGRGRRFDHIYASSELIPVSAAYLPEPRLTGLSDHSPIEVVFTCAERDSAI
jgi:exonuclease III